MPIEQENTESFSLPTPKRIRSNSSPEALKESTEKRKREKSENMKSGVTKATDSTCNQQLLDSIKQMFQAEMANLSTKQDIEKVSITISKLVDEVGNQKQEIVALRKENNELKNNMVKLEMNQKKNNLLFFGVPSSDADPITAINELCKNILGIEERMLLSRAYKIGKSSSVDRPILAEFVQGTQIDMIFSNVKKLKGTGIVIQKDYPLTIRYKRSKLLALRREILKVNNTLKVSVVYDVLYVQGYKFVWLQEEGKLQIGYEDGMNKLVQLTDLKRETILETLNIKEDVTTNTISAQRPNLAQQPSQSQPVQHIQSPQQ